MTLVLLLLAIFRPLSPPPDYAAIYDHGVPFSEFLEAARSRRDEWQARYREASIPDLVAERARALQAKRRLLVVAEDWCGDSAQTVPYLARLVEAAPDRLDMHIVDSKIGRPVMDAHPTPDGRGATPTIVVLTSDNVLVGAWSERPAELEAWAIEQRSRLTNRELHDRMAKWYAGDAGRSAIGEILSILAR